MSAPDAATARKKLRPMRPNPLIPTRTVTGLHLPRDLATVIRCAAHAATSETLSEPPTEATGQSQHMYAPLPRRMRQGRDGRTDQRTFTAFQASATAAASRLPAP